MKSFKLFALILALLLGSSHTQAQDDQHYTAPSKSIQFGFNYGSYRQQGYPNLKSDYGFSLTAYHSYWLYKPGNGRFRLGIDVAWVDLNYYNYKVNTTTLDGMTFHTSFHQGDIGIQGGIGMNFNITRDVRLHFRTCYNPAFSGIIQSSKIHGAFGNYGLCGLQLTWKHIGLGIDFRYGSAKYKNFSIFEDDENESYAEDADINVTVPGTVETSGHIKTKLFSIRSNIVFNF